jgi:SAM-dependent methyltransferase
MEKVEAQVGTARREVAMAGRPNGVDRDWQAEFQRTYAGPPSRIEERIWREVYGAEYPEGLDPHSFLSRSELDRFVGDLALRPGQVLVDLGCGRGGPSLWVAAATRAHLVGVDIAVNALEAARARAAAMHADAEFRQGSFEATGLRDETAHAVMSVDALLFTPSKTDALVELRRILRPGGRLVFTSWEFVHQPAGRPPQVDDHRPLLRAAGFDVRAYDETDDWRGRQDRIIRALLDAVEELAAEAGEPVEMVRRDLEEQAAVGEAVKRRVFAVAVAS